MWGVYAYYILYLLHYIPIYYYYCDGGASVLLYSYRIMYGHLFESRSIRRRRHWFIITDRRASFRYQSHHGPPNPKSSVSV